MEFLYFMIVMVHLLHELQCTQEQLQYVSKVLGAKIIT